MLDLTKKYRTRDGREVVDLFHDEPAKLIRGYVIPGRLPRAWYLDGNYACLKDHELDLIEIKDQPMTEQDIKPGQIWLELSSYREIKVEQVTDKWVFYSYENGAGAAVLDKFIQWHKLKPEPQWVAWDEESVPKKMFMCKYKDGEICAAVYKNKFMRILHSHGVSYTCGFEGFMNDYTYLDGSKCGRKVE